MDKVSIISANYNKAQFLVEMIDSVLVQDHKDWELIIVDDCSSDESPTILTETKNPQIKVLFNEKNLGGNYSRNRGLQYAKGDYVIFLDSDDLIAPTCLSKRLDAIRNASCDMVVFPMDVFKESIGDSPELESWIPKEGNHLNRFLAHDLPWAICQPLWRKEFLKELNGFDESFVRLQDVELHTRAIFKGAKVKIFSSDPDCFYRIDESRIVTNYNDFLSKHVKGTVQYVNKFLTECTEKQVNNLHLTLLSSLSLLVHHRISKNLTNEKYAQLNKELINASKKGKFRWCLNSYSFIGRLSPVHVRGLKWFFTRLIKRL